jgi:hypothetical protein
MRVAGETVGGKGITLMAVTAVVGIVLGAHGWSGRSNGVSPGLAGPQPSVSAKPSSAPSAAPSQSAPNQGPTVAPTPKPGPKLSSQSYASYAFAVWPGTPSAAAKAAETGLVIKVTKQGTGITVAASVAGQPLPSPRYYPTGAHVYVIEASMGDDGGNSDYNLGDDGLVVTDAQGRILQ